MAGRAASLPQAGYRQPERLFLGGGECRVVVYPEDGGPAAEIDLTVLPVSRALQEWLAQAVAGVTGPSGPRRARTSALDTLSILKRFCRFLASLPEPPTSPAQLRPGHLEEFILRGGKPLHRDLSSLRVILRFAPGLPAPFAARLAQASVPKSDTPTRSYSEAEFKRITTLARSDLRAAATRIAAGRRELAVWREGGVEQSDRAAWEHGFLLDHVDRHGDVPRQARRERAVEAIVARHGGAPAVMSRLHLTYHEMAAGFVLLMTLTGHNYSTVAALTTAHQRPDGHAAGSAAAALVDMVKPRRGAHRAAMSTALYAAPGTDRLDLASPFGIYELLLDLGAEARSRCGTESLFACFHHTGPKGRGFRAGVPKAVLMLWGQYHKLVYDEPDPETGEMLELRVDGRRLRLTWLELNQKPVAHTESTLANEYLARNRGNLAEYQSVVAKVLDEQVQAARSRPPIPVLTAEEVELAGSDPATVAARHGMDPAGLADLLDGRLDTVLTGCADNLASPYNPPGAPCTASFLLCLSCRCARATPAHLPIQVLVYDAIETRKQEMTPLRWAERYAQPATRLADLLSRHHRAAIDDARKGATDHDRELAERFLTRGLDHA